MLEKSCQLWFIWYLLFFCHGAEDQLQWVVKEKVTAYGQNLILVCPVENCCSEPAGWSVGPKSIILDVKTFSNDPKVKYHGTYNKDGFGVVIRNLSEADLNVTYRCVYGFDQSTPKYLIHGDVFRKNQLQWVVKEKVTGYGQNLILFCPVENCCIEPAGWSVGHKWIIFGNKTFSNVPKEKYHGIYDKDGFGVVIRGLSEADLDVTYRCVYGFDHSTPKYLLHGDAFRKSQLQWVVKEKVTAYGQNLILVCPVENCCSEPAGWSVGPKSIILDVKTFSNDPKVKYHGTYDKDGFGVVIRNLSEADLDVIYRCVYGFDQSIPKYLLHADVFRENQLQWVVKEKVTGYGQNLILFCPVENCCSEPAGWSVGHKWIIFYAKTFSNDPKVKYHGTYDKDGFGVVIRNLSEADLDVTYRCVYGFDHSSPKNLLHGDAFRENVPDKDKEIDTAAIVVSSVVIMVGIIIGMAYCVYRSRTDKEKETLFLLDIQIENQQGTDKEKEALYRSDIQIENQQGTDKEKEALYRSDIQIENQQDERITNKMEDIRYVCALINDINEIPVMETRNRVHGESSLDHLCSGHFKITPLAYRRSTVYMCPNGSEMRLTYSKKKFTNFIFRKKIEAGKTYFYIFPVDYPDYYVKMGMCSLWVTCEKGDPEGCNDGTREIKCLKYNKDDCYVLCTKDSNGNYFSAGSMQKMHGKRGDIDKRIIFLTQKSNSLNDDTNNQLMLMK